MTSSVDACAWSATNSVANSVVNLPNRQESIAKQLGLRLFFLATFLVGCAVVWGNPNYQWQESREQPYGADFLQEWVAGHMLSSTATATQIYDRHAFDQLQHDPSLLGFEWNRGSYYPAVYPPIYYYLVAPFAWLPYRWAVLAWCLCLLVAYAMSAVLHAWRPWNQSEINRSPSHANKAWWFWIVALWMPAMFMGVVMGQKGSLWLLLLVVAWQLLRANRPFTSGIVSALLIVKPTLVPVLFAAMLLNRQWRYVAGFLAGAMAIFGVSWFLLPASLWSDYLQVVLGSASYQDHSGYRTGWSTSSVTLLQSLGLPRPAVIGLWCVSSSLILLSLVRRRDDRPLAEDPRWLFAVLAATALVSPHFYYYDLVWLLYPLCGMWLRQPRQALLAVMALWLSMLAAQQWESGWPLVCLCLITLHVKYLRMRSLTDTDQVERPISAGASTAYVG